MTLEKRTASLALACAAGFFGALLVNALTPKAVAQDAQPAAQVGRYQISTIPGAVYLLDTRTGKMLWRRTDLKINHENGAGSTPVSWGDFLVFHCDGSDEQCDGVLHDLLDAEFALPPTIEEETDRDHDASEEDDVGDQAAGAGQPSRPQPAGRRLRLR